MGVPEASFPSLMQQEKELSTLHRAKSLTEFDEGILESIIERI